MSDKRSRGPRSRSRREILENATRCIYCNELPVSIEHMPPRGIFFGKRRPSGLEFPACQACNEGTRAADAVAAFFGRLRPWHGNADDPLYLEAQKSVAALRIQVPGVIEEVFDHSPSEEMLVNRNGILQRVVQVRARSPKLAAHLVTIGAKLAMALYAEHVGEPLPMGGATYIQPSLNAGMSQEQADSILSIMPMGSTLNQGKFSVPDQFAYRFNTDERSIFAALVSVHQNLHFLVFATSAPETYGPVLSDWTAATVRPGQLGLAIGMHANMKPRYLQGNARPGRTASGLLLPGLGG